MPQTLHAFDLDHTLVDANSGILFFHFLVQSRILHPLAACRSFLYAIQHHLFKTSLKTLHHKVFKKLLINRSLSDLKKQVNQFLSCDFYRFLYPPAFCCLRRAQHQGDRVIILSNSPDFLVAPIADYLGVDTWRASQYSANDEGKLHAIQSILVAEGKAEALHHIARQWNIPMERTVAYSDSHLDIPFLKSAGKAVVVNPSREMRSRQKEYQWPII
ncbi:MAG: HAD family phosphatase [Chlamydiota bacterium]|nr:HAD family phosphatase [Chlamydiota bacterium]